jgi:type III secretion system YopR family effector
MSRIELGLPGAPPIVVSGHKPITQVDPVQIQAFEHALKVEPASRVSLTEAESRHHSGASPPSALRKGPPLEEVAALADELQERCGSQGPLPLDTRHWLQAKLKSLTPNSKQQEGVLSQVWGVFEAKEENKQLTSLVKDELQTLILENGMIDNLMRNAYKLDLES